VIAEVGNIDDDVVVEIDLGFVVTVAENLFHSGL
jgi:hypothetical protein